MNFYEYVLDGFEFCVLCSLQLTILKLLETAKALNMQI